MVAMHLLLRILLLASWDSGLCGITTYYYFMPSSQAVPPTPPPSPYRAVFYPIRTNCNRPCPAQNRYRWHFRPTVSSSSVNNTVPIPYPYIRPDISSQTSVNPVPTQPFSGARVINGVLPTANTTYSPSTASYISTTEALPTPPPFAQNLPVRRQNPCPNGTPLLNENGNPMTCNFVVQPNGGCPVDYWCHTGSSFETTTCCPKTSPKRDICDLPKSNGDGEELIPRWYFDATTRKCKPFLYRGMKGNANNFITSIGCMESCERGDRAAAVKNPCGSGVPARGLDGELFVCGRADSSSSREVADDPYRLFTSKNKRTNGECPAGYYCHVGESAQTTTCCEISSSEPCVLNLMEGEGGSDLTRWYYSREAKDCVEFSYKGLKGNENNFLSLTECKKRCMKRKNPCPVMHDYSEKRECSSESDQCGPGEWCHIGSNKETTVCCPSASPDACKLRLDLGQGDENLTRWYADPMDETCSRECRPFDYRGMKGNQNNFLSKASCEASCKPSECTNPCSSGDLLVEPNGKARKCNSTSPCPVNYWCHLGAGEATTVCCSRVKRACDLPVAEGVGKAVLSRWYYNKRDQNCQKFTYTGTGGNQNSYITEDECLNACPTNDNPCSSGEPLMVDNRPKICSPQHRCPGTHFCHISAPDIPNYCCPKNGDPCEHIVSPGLGPFSIQRFYYDKNSRRCTEFIYRGAKGNANNFLTVEDCQLVCQAGFKNPCQSGHPLTDTLSNEPVICGGEELCPNGYFCHVGSGPETTNCCPGTRKACDLSIEPGSGGDRLERWGYDGGARMCRQFTYFGLKGNVNNFISKELCAQACNEFNPCLNGEPLTNSQGERTSCRIEDPEPCPGRYYCHVGSGESASVCCQRTTSANACDLPKNHGVGRDLLTRWYHNSLSGECETFQYYGTRGNENNFPTRELCERTCLKYRSYCPHGLPLIDENQIQKKPVSCGPYKGCPTLYLCHNNLEHDVSVCCENPTNFCLQAREPGTCDGDEDRYGYNPLTDSCVAYKYSGCGGTLNNFKSLEKCTEICCREYRRKMREDDERRLIETIDFD